MYRPTQRTYYNKLTGDLFRMYHSNITGTNYLMNEETGHIIKSSVLIAAFNAQTFKLSNGKIIELKQGEFYPLACCEIATHKKFTGLQKRFVKI